MVKEKLNWTFTVKLDDRRRITIPKNVADAMKLSNGDIISLEIVNFIRKPVAPLCMKKK